MYFISFEHANSKIGSFMPCRPRRGVSTFSGSRRTLRPRLFACVATADVEQAEQVESSEAAAPPAEAVEQAQPQENTDSRRRSRPPQQGRRPPKKDVIYAINDLAVGQELDATVVRSFCPSALSVSIWCAWRCKELSNEAFSCWQVGVTTYGAFVDYGGGKDALIHISQLKVPVICLDELSDIQFKGHMVC